MQLSFVVSHQGDRISVVDPRNSLSTLNRGKRVRGVNVLDVNIPRVRHVELHQSRRRRAKAEIKSSNRGVGTRLQSLGGESNFCRAPERSIVFGAYRFIRFCFLCLRSLFVYLAGTSEPQPRL